MTKHKKTDTEGTREGRWDIMATESRLETPCELKSLFQHPRTVKIVTNYSLLSDSSSCPHFYKPKSSFFLEYFECSYDKLRPLFCA